MRCTFLPLFTPCAPPSARGHVPRPRLLLPLCDCRAPLVTTHARPACVPCSPLLYPCPAALTALSLCHVLSPLPTTSPCPNPVSHGGALLAHRCLNITVGYHCPCCTPSPVVHSPPPPMRLMPLPFALESGRTRRPLALAHQCGCPSCGTTSLSGPQSLQLRTSQAGSGRAIRAPATFRPNGTSAAPPRWSPGCGQSASQGSQPYRGAIMQSFSSNRENAG